MNEIERAECSRRLASWLRHKPELAGLTLQKGGWATIEGVLAALEVAGAPTTGDEIRYLVRLDPRRRFEIDEDKIRARFGHSVEIEEPHAGAPPAVLFHAAPMRYAERILKAGLKPVKRALVHLAVEKKAAPEICGRRANEAALIRVDAHGAYAAGVRFFPRGRGVWLSESIPAQYLTQVIAPVEEGDDEETAVRPRGRRPGERRRTPPKGGFMPEFNKPRRDR